MPFDEVMHKFKHGELHSGSKHGKKVTNRKQAIAIMLSEKRKAAAGKEEYKSKKKKKKMTEPSKAMKAKHNIED